MGASCAGGASRSGLGKRGKAGVVAEPLFVGGSGGGGGASTVCGGCGCSGRASLGRTTTTVGSDHDAPGGGTMERDSGGRCCQDAGSRTPSPGVGGGPN